MYSPPTCPRCRQAVDPTAPFCGACGNPLSFAPYPAPPPMPPPPIPSVAHPYISVRTSANWAIGLSAAFALCCAPLSIVGAALGIRAMVLAKKHGLPVPVRAVLSIPLGGLSTALLVIGLVVNAIQTRETKQRLDVVESRLDGKREAAALAKPTACDLVEEKLLDDGYDGQLYGLGDVHCDGALDATADRATLHDATFTWTGNKSYTANACFARGARWYLLEVGAGLDCADVPVPPAPAGATPAALREAEKKARASLPKLEEADRADRMADALLAAKAALAREGLAEKACTRSDFAPFLKGKDDRLKVDTVDFDLLDAHTGDAKTAEWPFLTSDRVKEILAEAQGKEPSGTPAVDERKESGPFLVVYRGILKLWPKISEKEAFIGKKLAYSSGGFAGWMAVVRTDNGQLVCQEKLTFESGDDITYEKGHIESDRDKAKEAVEKDFKDRFEDAATERMKTLGGGGLRLGYKVLE